VLLVPKNTVQASMAHNLTTRQIEIIEYLRRTQRETGVMPSTRELQRYFGFASQTAAMSHLRGLEKKGIIQRLPGKARAVVFPNDLNRAEICDIPIYGHIAAGFAEVTEQQEEGYLSIDAASLGLPSKCNTFALKVRGDSMIDAHICDGDTVVLERREPRNQDIVAALIDGETTLKRLIHENGKTYLKAENPNFPELIPVNDLSIQGVFVALIRQAA
jgi:repressor LexA